MLCRPTGSGRRRARVVVIEAQHWRTVEKEVERRKETGADGADSRDTAFVEAASFETDSGERCRTKVRRSFYQFGSAHRGLRPWQLIRFIWPKFITYYQFIPNGFPSTCSYTNLVVL